MNKTSLTGIVLLVLIFVGFTWYNGKQQQKYRAAMEAYNAEQARLQAEADSIAALYAPEAETETLAAADTTGRAATLQQRMAEELGAMLAAAQRAEAEEFTVENEVLKVDFSTRGGRIAGVTLKDYTRYAPKGERNELVQLFDPATARFNTSFYVKHGFHNVLINTNEYTFDRAEIRRMEDRTIVEMALPIDSTASFRYRYTIYDQKRPERDYLVDFEIELNGMAPLMANQTALDLTWENTSYRNERGFENENMYTTIAWRNPGEASIEELGMGDGRKDESVTTAVNWVAFKQQYFSSVLIGYDNLKNAAMAFDTAQPGSGYIKTYTLTTSLPYSPATEAYRMGFYLGPNKYAILKKVVDPDGEPLALERLVPLGWGIIGWVNRWLVIPVFDFLREYIPSFGIIILILALLVKLIISPLTYKSYVSMAKMRVIKPEVDELAKRYPKQEDAMKRQQATMELYKKAGINPMSGCIPMLIQMPIIIAMFRFFPASIELRGEPFLWADDLSSYDSVLQLPFNIPFYGDHVSLFALLMAGALFLFSLVNYNQTASSQPQMAGMKFMMVYLMPVMMLFWFNSYSSGLCYYYFLANLITIAQTMLIRRMIDDEKIHAVMEANAAKNQNRKKSKFQLRYEELMRQQELQAKKRK